MGCMSNKGADILDGLGLIKDNSPPVNLEEGPCRLVLPLAAAT